MVQVLLSKFTMDQSVLGLRRPTSQVKYYSNQWFGWGTICGTSLLEDTVQTYLHLLSGQWGASNVCFLVLSSWKVNIAENLIAIMGF